MGQLSAAPFCRSPSGSLVLGGSATLGAMYPGRFWLGLGAGEALNEHVIGGECPEIGVRSAMMFEIEAYNRMVPTDDRREGILAFNEKRKPDFSRFPRLP